MKPVAAALVALCLLSKVVVLQVASAEPVGVIQAGDLPVEQVLVIYQEISKVDLIVASNVRQAARTITIQTKRALTRAEMSRLLEKALLKQAGVIVTRLDGRRVSVTYNDRLVRSQGPR